MMNKKLIKEVQDAIDFSGYTKEYYRSLLQKCLVDSGEDRLEEYNRGAEDAWELARKIWTTSSKGSYSYNKLSEIFNLMCPENIMNKYSAKEALEKVQAYEKKKEEAKKEIKVGDVVEYNPKVFNHSHINTGIFVGENSDYIWVITSEHDKYKVPQQIPKASYIIKKTGKHFDIQGMLDEIKTDD